MNSKRFMQAAALALGLISLNTFAAQDFSGLGTTELTQLKPSDKYLSFRREALVLLLVSFFAAVSPAAAGERLTLSQALDLALKENPNLDTASARSSEAEAGKMTRLDILKAEAARFVGPPLELESKS